jgi:hypothetical protein
LVEFAHPSTAAGKCFFDMLEVFAEFETNLRRERQLDEIAKAKAAGVYKGRPVSIDEAKLQPESKGATKIAEVPASFPADGTRELMVAISAEGRSGHYDMHASATLLRTIFSVSFPPVLPEGK